MLKKLIFLFLFITLESYAQDYELRATPAIESKIVYKDGSSEEGKLWLASSTYKPRLKSKDEKGSKKINFREIDTIITNPNSESKKRIFQYLPKTYNRGVFLAELVTLDRISIYLVSNNGIDLFYSDFDRESIREKMIRTKYEGTPRNLYLPKSNTIELPDGRTIEAPYRYSYYYGLMLGETPSYQYYILVENHPKLIKVENNKRFLKKSREYFAHCPAIIESLEKNEITLSDLPKFIEYYKELCEVE